jgi:hypothetical protein
VPAVLFARLAVDRSIHGKGLVGFFLRDAMIRVLDLSEKLGIGTVVVDGLPVTGGHKTSLSWDRPGRPFLRQ